MLTELHIENLGVIERASLVLEHGVTALSGETGAGKTMLVEAIGLLVGGRADASAVRSGAPEARIDGRFETETPDGVDEIVLSRVVLAEGRSRAYVNGRPATVASLAEITRELVDLHGQHAHQSLLSTATQRAALDEFGAIDLGDLRSARARLTEIDAELATLGGDERARAREIDLLRFQVGELDDAAIDDADEDTRLAAEESLLADAVGHREAGTAALDALRGDEQPTDPLSAALQAIGDRQPFHDVASRLAGIQAELDDVVTELRGLTEAIEEQPERLAELRDRRQLLVELERKYGNGLAEVMAFHRDAEIRLRELEDYDRRAAELDAQRAAATTAERAAAEAVGRARRAAAPRLAAAVEEKLHQLAMPNAAIAVEVGRSDDDHPGDEVRFLLSANPGSPLLPLNRVASGGELARAMLALRLVLSGASDGGGSATLVFDEVDAGIGGAAAAAVGDALADLGAHHQVLIVTHLPQVAARATHQLVVAKTVRADETFTSVDEVSGDERIGEIARMLAGAETSAALEHARDLLDR
ncbi:DNA repair protein RecN [Ilumatobacter sp.]|uniref:DNA repair protein RecN n=1 Tax=Ilumatobacter sp. TaxID=1967498 RepID=UPI003AF560F8